MYKNISTSHLGVFLAFAGLTTSHLVPHTSAHSRVFLFFREHLCGRLCLVVALQPPLISKAGSSCSPLRGFLVLLSFQSRTDALTLVSMPMSLVNKVMFLILGRVNLDLQRTLNRFFTVNQRCTLVLRTRISTPRCLPFAVRANDKR